MIRKSCLALFLLSLLLSFSAQAKVVITVHDTPQTIEETLGIESLKAVAPEVQPATSWKGIVPSDPTFLLIPWFSVETFGFSDTTIWSATNLTSIAINMTATYFDTAGNEITVQNFSPGARTVTSVNMRDVLPLPIEGALITRRIGYMTLQADQSISGDFFQIDVSQDFATGNRMIELGDLCDNWTSRFIALGPGDLSQLNFLVNGPQGGAASDPPTVLGEVYDEAGSFRTSFELRTDQEAFRTDTASLVPAGLTAGYMRLLVNGKFSPGGFVAVEHRADGLFSAGLPSHCDTPFIVR